MRGCACVLAGYVDEAPVLHFIMLQMLAAPGQRKRLQEHTGFGRLLAGQVAGAAAPHQRKLQQDDLGGLLYTCSCQDMNQLRPNRLWQGQDA